MPSRRETTRQGVKIEEQGDDLTKNVTDESVEKGWGS